MCFELDSLPPIPVIAGAAVSHEDLVLEATDGNSFAAFAATPDEPAADRHRRPARRARPLPLLRGARAALRRARLRGGRDRLLRAHGRRRQARRRLRVHGARRADDAGRDPGRRRAPRSRGCASTARTAIFTVGFCFGGRNSWLAAAGGPRARGRGRLLRQPGERNGQPGPTAARRRDRPRRSSPCRPATTRTSPPS